jgi:hypothetical protein
MRTLVLVDEEYGYRYYLLFTDLTVAQLAQWWSSLEHIEYPLPVSFFPGELVAMETDKDVRLWTTYNRCLSLPYIHVHTDGDSLFTLPNKVKVKHKGYDEHYFDSKPGNRVAWFDTSTNPPTWRYGYYDENLEIVEDGQDDNSFWAV